MADPEQIERDLAFAIRAAREAGERLTTVRDSGRWEGETLGDVGDYTADGFLQGYVRGRYPLDGILSEETKDSPERLERQRTWILDPLDGTKEYRAMRDDWAVHVGLTVDGECELGAVALPAKDLLIWGICQPDDRRWGIEGTGELLTGDTESATPPRIACSRSHTPEWVERFGEAFGAELVHEGSVGNKIALLLLGQADLYVHRKGLKEWDTCAPEAIARALGWSVCKVDGSEHRYNQQDPRNDEIVVCRPSWKERVVETLSVVTA